MLSKNVLEREFNIDLIMTAPSVIYKVNQTDGESMDVSNPSEFPDPTKIATIEEPYVKAQIMVPQEFVGAVMELAQRKRGDFVTMDYIDDNRVNVIYQIPLAEIVFDFFDKLKSSTRGYASFDYELSEYRPSKLVKMDILLNGDKVDALSFIVHKDFAYELLWYHDLRLNIRLFNGRNLSWVWKLRWVRHIHRLTVGQINFVITDGAVMMRSMLNSRSKRLG